MLPMDPSLLTFSPVIEWVYGEEDLNVQRVFPLQLSLHAEVPQNNALHMTQAPL